MNFNVECLLMESTWVGFDVHVGPSFHSLFN